MTSKLVQGAPRRPRPREKVFILRKAAKSFSSGNDVTARMYQRMLCRFFDQSAISINPAHCGVMVRRRTQSFRMAAQPILRFGVGPKASENFPRGLPDFYVGRPSDETARSLQWAGNGPVAKIVQMLAHTREPARAKLGQHDLILRKGRNRSAGFAWTAAGPSTTGSVKPSLGW